MRRFLFFLASVILVASADPAAGSSRQNLGAVAAMMLGQRGAALAATDGRKGPTSPGPSGRERMGLAHDAATHQLVMFGGYDGAYDLADTPGRGTGPPGPNSIR